MRSIPRWLARAPIPLFKAGLGALLGGRFVMVEHAGRVSGRRRYVVLECVLREPRAVVVLSGFGWSSQWLRNVEATPRVRLWWGRVRAAPGHARILGPTEAHVLLERYRTEHPAQARATATALGVPELAGPAPLPDDIGERLPVVRLERD